MADERSTEQELAYWLERLKQLDSVLAQPVLTLIRLGVTYAGPDRIPSWISQGAAASERSFLVDALCCSTLQRVWRLRRRFSWLGRSDQDLLEALQPTIAKTATELAAPERELRELLADPVFGNLSPLTAGEILTTLSNAAENRAFGATGFAALVSIFWSLLASYAGDGRSTRDSRTLPAAITARWLLPLKELQTAIRTRARLYRAIRDVVRELEQFATKQGDPHFRWKFACTADRLAGLLLELSELAVNRTAMEQTAETVSRKTRELQAGDATVPYAEVRQTVADLVLDVRQENKSRLQSARRVLRRLERELPAALADPNDPCGLLTDLRPRRTGETQDQYRARLRDTASDAVSRCLDGLKHLRHAVFDCLAVLKKPSGADDPTAPRRLVSRLKIPPPRDTDALYWTLTQLAAANEAMAEIIESIARPAAERCREIVRQEVAYASSGNDTEFDATELLSAVLIAERWDSISDLEIDDALSKALRARRPDGSWSTGQPIFREKRVLGLWPNTSDTVSLLSSAIRARPRIRSGDDALMKFIDWLDRNRTELDSELGAAGAQDDERPKTHLVGWSTEARDAKTIDLWTTAVSIGALLEIREVIEYRLWQLCETRFSVLGALKRLDDVDPVDLGATHASRLHYRLRTAARRTRGNRYDNAEYSFVLHGPPGSSKTALAEALGSEMWHDHGRETRVVRITPADFTRQGEAGVDAEARFIFALLSNVRRVTIIFDEIDDLLRRREMKGPPSFLKMIIPAMLNRLQDLRDAAARQEICYIIAMNYVDNVEPALVRPGRVDAVIPIVYPDPWSRENTLHRVIAQRKADPFDEGIRARIVGSTAGWPWATYNRLCREIVGKGLQWKEIEKKIEDLRGEVQSAAYSDADRWSPISPPLVNEVAHFVFAFARTERECIAQTERLMISDGNPVLTRATSEVVRKISGEWQREGRAKLAAVRTTSMGMTLFPEEKAVVRVWAPGVDKVEVDLRSPNDVRGEPRALAEEGEGVWAAELDHVSIGDRYRYVFTTSTPALTIRRSDPYGREVDESGKHTIIGEPTLPSFPPRLLGWHDLILYQIDPATFTSEGTYMGIASRLSDLAQLGVNAIELLGAGELRKDTQSLSGDELFETIMKIERGYGSLAELHDLVDEAHRNQIAIFVGVTTHTLLGRAVANFYNFTPPNRYFQLDRDLQSTELGPRPDFNERHVVDLMTENALRWVREIGVDGLRWAGTNFVRRRNPLVTQFDEWREGWQLLQRINAAVGNLGRGTLMIAQDVAEHPRMVTGESGCAGFGAQWSPAFEDSIWSVLTSRSSPDLNALKLAVERRGADAFRRVIFSESHQTRRKRGRSLRSAIEKAGYAPQEVMCRLFQAMALTLTAPGIPLLLQGQELFDDTDGPFEWDVMRRGMLRRLQDLIACRRNRRHTTQGLRGHYVSCLQGKRGDDIFIVNRWEADPSESVVIVFNFSSTPQFEYPIRFPDTAQWDVRFNPAAATYGTELGTHDSYSVTVEPNGIGRVSVGPNSLVILSRAALGDAPRLPHR